MLEKERPDTKIVVAEPAEAPMLTSGTEQQRNPDGSPAAGHPAWNPHPIQGWSPDFIPKLTGDAIAAKYVDRIITIPAPEAMQWSKQLAQKEGIFVGVSAGGTFGAAMKVCADAPNGSTVLAMLPDTGERYLSTPLFADISADMTEEEQAIARSMAVTSRSFTAGARRWGMADTSGIDPAYPYATHLNVLFGALEKIELDPLVSAVRDQWYNQTLARVNDSVVRLGVMQGEYHWHRHDEDDEFFYVVEGRFLIDLEPSGGWR